MQVYDICLCAENILAFNNPVPTVDTNLSRDYAVPDVTKSSLMSPNVPVQPSTTYSPNVYGRTPMGSPHHALPSASSGPPPYMGAHYASSEVVPVHNIQVCYV